MTFLHQKTSEILGSWRTNIASAVGIIKKFQKIYKKAMIEINHQAEVVHGGQQQAQ